MKDFANSILSLPRYSNRAIAIITDLGLCIICTWIAFIIRLGRNNLLSKILLIILH